VAADALLSVVGPSGARAISVLVALAALGAIHGCIFTGARSAWALGSDFAPFRMLARWHGARNTPLNAILVQGAIVVILIALPALGPRFEKWLGSGFQYTVVYTAPAFWTFLLLTGLSVFVLRRREPASERPFRIPLYPLPAIVFVLMCGYMLYSSIAYTKIGALVGLAVLVAGVPVNLLFRGRSRVPGLTEP
jgi:amino acid transporter